MEREEFYEELIDRQKPLIDRESQRKIRYKKFCVVGVGANGAPAAEALVRFGAENITIADPDTVELSNLNRQPYYLGDIGDKKVYCIERKLLQINPNVEIESFPEGLTTENVYEVLKGVGIVIDAADDYRAKVALSRATKERNLPTVHTAGGGWRGGVTTFFPEKITYEEMFGLPSLGRELDEVSDEEFLAHRKKVARIVGRGMYQPDLIERMDDLEQFWPTLISACQICGTIAADEAIKIATGREDLVIAAPRILQIDTMNNGYEIFEFGKDGKHTSFK